MSCNEITTVCNVKVSHIRPQYKNLKEWMNDESNVYIGRAGVVFVDNVRFPPNNSEWANPFKIGKHGDRSCVLNMYQEYIKQKLKSDQKLQQKMAKLKGKNLGCWCVDSPVCCESGPVICHGQILLKLIEEQAPN